MKVFHSSRRQKLWETGGNESGVAIVVCDALASTHHLRYVREERATRGYDYSLRYVKRLEQSVEQRVAPCFQNEYSDVVWFRQPDSSIRLSPRQGPTRRSKVIQGDTHD